MKYQLIEQHESSHWGGSDSCSYNDSYSHTYFPTYREALEAFEKTKNDNTFNGLINSSNLVKLMIFKQIDGDESNDQLVKSWELN